MGYCCGVSLGGIAVLDIFARHAEKGGLMFHISVVLKRIRKRIAGNIITMSGIPITLPLYEQIISIYVVKNENKKTRIVVN